MQEFLVNTANTHALTNEEYDKLMSYLGSQPAPLIEMISFLLASKDQEDQMIGKKLYQANMPYFMALALLNLRDNLNRLNGDKL